MNDLDTGFLATVATQMMNDTQVTVAGKSWLVTRTSSSRLKTVRFQMNGRDCQAIEQNPEKPSRWGKLAREGHQVVQFRDVATGKYVAVAVDGEVKVYGRERG